MKCPSISRGPESFAKRLPRYPVAFSRVLRNDIAPYAFVVDAKDDKAARCYQRFPFRFLVEGGRRLFIPTAEIAKLFS